MNTKIKTDEELNAAMRQLVKNIMGHVDHVYNFPLTPEAQTNFVRMFCHQAKEIRDTEPFLRLEMMTLAEEYKRLGAPAKKTQAATSQGQKSS